MSAAVFPTLSGLAWDVKRTQDWSGNRPPTESVSGKRTARADWSYPRWRWELAYNYLRSDANAEFQTLAGFINARQGMFDTFLYADPDDNTVTNQAIGAGDGTTHTFQLLRTFGGFLEPIYAPHLVSNVYLNGVNQPTGWSISNWGSATPGILTFSSAPGSGVAITATFSFYFPCRFDDPTAVYTKCLASVYKTDTIRFSSEK